MKALLQKFMGVSGGHQVITRVQAEQLHLDDQWQDPALPQRQYAIVEKELKQIAATNSFPAHMQALVDQMKLINLTKPSVLEIGCSSGYYNEVFRLAGLTVDYTGCDYSSAFIDFAKQLYPQLSFQTCDAAQLPYQDQQFDVAISGCCILHILDYPKAIQETARVAKQYMIFSRTPIVHLAPTVYTKKTGYGIPMIEIFFNESELFTLFRQAGFAVIATNTFAQGVRLGGEPTFITTYLCQRIK